MLRDLTSNGRFSPSLCGQENAIRQEQKRTAWRSHCATVLRTFFTLETSRRRIWFLAVGPFLLILRLGLFERNFGKIRCLMEHIGKKRWKWWWRIQIKAENIQNDPCFFWKASSALNPLMVEIQPGRFSFLLSRYFGQPLEGDSKLLLPSSK